MFKTSIFFILLFTSCNSTDNNSIEYNVQNEFQLNKDSFLEIVNWADNNIWANDSNNFYALIRVRDKKVLRIDGGAKYIPIKNNEVGYGGYQLFKKSGIRSAFIHVNKNVTFVFSARNKNLSNYSIVYLSDTSIFNTWLQNHTYIGTENPSPSLDSFVYKIDDNWYLRVPQENFSTGQYVLNDPLHIAQ